VLDAKALITYNFTSIDSAKLEQLAQLEQLYTFWNSQINIVSRKDIEELMLRHVLHSLAITKYIAFNPDAQIMDLGCGGGFPGIPLAIMFPETEFLLVDSIGKKIKVVTEIAKALDLKNVTAWHGRAEDVKQQFDFVVSRAVAPLEKLLYWTYRKYKKTSSHTSRNGLICLKGGDLHQEISDAHNYLKASKINPKIKLIEISEWYKNDFFETKKLIYCEM